LLEKIFLHKQLIININQNILKNFHFFLDSNKNSRIFAVRNHEKDCGSSLKAMSQ